MHRTLDNTIPLANGITDQALHVNGINPHHAQQVSFLMTCNPCDKPHDLKGVIKDIMQCVCTQPDDAYDTLHFSEVDTEGGNNTWRCLFIRFSTDYPAHSSLRNILLLQPDNFTATLRSDSTGNDASLWFEPPFATAHLAEQMAIPLQDRTRSQIAFFVKQR